MRVAEMFIASILEIDDNGDFMDDKVDVKGLSEDYYDISIEDLEKTIDNSNFTEKAVKLNTVLDTTSIQYIKEQLQERVVVS